MFPWWSGEEESGKEGRIVNRAGQARNQPNRVAQLRNSERRRQEQWRDEEERREEEERRRYESRRKEELRRKEEDRRWEEEQRLREEDRRREMEEQLGGGAPFEGFVKEWEVGVEVDTDAEGRGDNSEGW